MRTEIIKLVSNVFSRTITENKVYFLEELAERLTAAGYTAQFMAKAPFLANAKINLKVTKPDYECWIEIDNKSPRLRSIERIAAVLREGQDGFILLRNSFLKPHSKLGIDIISARR